MTSISELINNVLIDNLKFKQMFDKLDNNINSLIDSNKDIKEVNNKLLKKINSLELKIDMISIYQQQDKNLQINIKEIKREKLKYDIKIAKKFILMPQIEGEVEFFKYLYLDNINKELYPIKIEKKKLSYWLNNKWNLDDGIYLKNTILKNISSIYFEINNLSNFSEELFINNQKKYMIYEILRVRI